MISESTKGKDVGGLSNVANVISNENTDCLLAVADKHTCSIFRKKKLHM